MGSALSLGTGLTGETGCFPRTKRRGRDSNPRPTFRQVRDFQSRSLGQLGHLSESRQGNAPGIGLPGFHRRSRAWPGAATPREARVTASLQTVRGQATAACARPYGRPSPRARSGSLVQVEQDAAAGMNRGQRHTTHRSFIYARRPCRPCPEFGSKRERAGSRQRRRRRRPVHAQTAELSPAPSAADRARPGARSARPGRLLVYDDHAAAVEPAARHPFDRMAPSQPRGLARGHDRALLVHVARPEAGWAGAEAAPTGRSRGGSTA